MKYIMFRHDSNSGTIRYSPFIFPDSLVHADVAKHMTHYHLLGPEWRPDTAGFFDVATHTCSGESETLKLKSNPVRDRLIIINYEYTRGVEGALHVFR